MFQSFRHRASSHLMSIKLVAKEREQAQETTERDDSILGFQWVRYIKRKKGQLQRGR